MAQLAIKGHKTRGSEVIALLEMLGGKNIYNLTDSKEIWYILSNCTIEHSAYLFEEKGFTLEEFLEKFPYKVGDKVSSKYLKNYKIEKMEWEDTNNRVIYKLQGMGWYSADELQPYKAEIMEKEISGAIIDRFICLEGYDFYDDKGNIIDTKEITMKKKKPKYPKTFVECAKMLDCFCAAHIDGYYCRLLEDLQALLICRDAYWKIAGDWKPNLDSKQHKFAISNVGNKISFEVYGEYNSILCFPTEEMRDAFYENFKELIEQCKELL